ncbi:hypothetical protein WR25_23635 isoform B [Diploscapter pachys]|nr:hypothetical protein WR25_23635 isoform B [Diploscapter pachys]
MINGNVEVEMGNNAVPEKDNVDFASPLQSIQQNGSGTGNGSPEKAKGEEAKKKKNKNKPKKEDKPNGYDAGQEYQEKTTIHHVQASNSHSEPKKAAKKKLTIIRDLDSDKVLTRLASVEEIEPEYIGFLATYFHDTTAANNDLRQKLNAKASTEAELQNKLEEAKTLRMALERQVVDKDRQLQITSSKLTATQSAAEQFHGQTEQLHVENEGLKKAINAASVAAAEVANKQAELDAFRQKETTLNRRVSQLEGELKQLKLNNEHLQKSAEDTSELEKVQTEFIKLEQVARELKTQLEEKNAALGEAKKRESGAVTAEDLTKIQKEKESILNDFEASKIEWEKKETALMTEYHSLQSLVDELNKEVAKFETFKKEQEDLEQQLRAKEKELAEKSAKLREAESQVFIPSANQDKVASLEKTNVELKSEVENLTKKLIAAEKKAASATPQSNGIEEEVVLKKTKGLDAAPSTGSNEEVQKLKDENQRLKAKNDELRERNLKILEQVNGGSGGGEASVAQVKVKAAKGGEENSNSLVEERRLVVELLGPLAKSTKAKLEDKTAYSKWLNETANNLTKQLADAVNKAGKSNSQTKVTTAESNNNNNNDVTKYKDALTVLTGELTRIEHLYAEGQSRYEAKIAELEQKLSRAVSVIDSVHKLKGELKQCQELKRQIVDLKTTLTSEEALADPSRPSPGSASSAKSDDGEWEVVSS